MKDDSPVLYNRAMILANLSTLVKHECLITVFLGTKKLLLTTILELNTINNIIVLDTSIVESLNHKLLTTKRVKFCTVFNGVHVAFTSDPITRVKHGQHDVFIMPIPRSLYWFNRRDAYRVKIANTDLSFCKLLLFPLGYTAIEKNKENYIAARDKIKIQALERIEQQLIQEESDFWTAVAKMSEKEAAVAKIEREALEKERAENPVVPDEEALSSIQLQLFDISISGCSMLNSDEEFSHFLNVKSLFNNCLISMPNHGEIRVSLEIATKRLFEESTQFSELVCFRFVEPKPSTDSIIFRYIQALDRFHKNYSAENLFSTG